MRQHLTYDKYSESQSLIPPVAFIVVYHLLLANAIDSFATSQLYYFLAQSFLQLMSLLRSTIQALSMEQPLLSSKAMNKWTEAFVLHLLKRTTNIKEAIFSIETYHCHNASMLANVSRCSMLASPCTKTACGQVPHTSTPHQVFHLQSVFPKENWEDEERYAPSPQPPLTHPQPNRALCKK